MAGMTSIRMAVPLVWVAAMLAGSPVKADLFILNMANSGVKGPASTLEALPPTVDYSITVKNPNLVDSVVLDFALVTTLYVSGDPTDVISFPTVVQFPAILAPGASGTFIYSVTNGDDPFDGTDSGVTDFSFSAEYSVISGAANPNTQYLGTAGGALMVQGPQSNVQDAATLAALVGCLANPITCANPPADFLYPPTANGGNLAYGTFASLEVTVKDVPEPSTWVLMLLGFVGLGAAVSRKRGGLTKLLT
jgi:PEP-CTERM motif